MPSHKLIIAGLILLTCSVASAKKPAKPVLCQQFEEVSTGDGSKYAFCSGARPVILVRYVVTLIPSPDNGAPIRVAIGYTFGAGQ